MDIKQKSPAKKDEPRASDLSQISSMKTIATATFICVAAYAVLTFAQDSPNNLAPQFKLPPQSVFIDPLSFAVLPQNATFRNLSFTDLFNPTSTAPPFFQIFDQSFLNILGPNPSVQAVAHNATFAFAHEAPIYNAATDEVFFASNDGGPLGNSDINHNNQYGKISLKAVEAALAAKESSINVPVTELNLPDTIQMTNGGTGPFKGSLILITSGRGPLPPSIALVNPKSPNNVTVVLNNYFGRQFNSLNDIKVHPSGNFFFTDVIYGFLNHFRPEPLMPSQVYRFDPRTGSVRVVATDFDKPNGIAFSADGSTAYIADTGASQGFLGNNQTHPATLYAFDVDKQTQAFTNRRIFAYVDTGVPDGVQVDVNGNVFSSCADGVHVWNTMGDLIGKIFLGTSSANLVFAGDGRLVILAETTIFVAKIAAKGIPPLFP